MLRRFLILFAAVVLGVGIAEGIHYTTLSHVILRNTQVYGGAANAIVVTDANAELHTQASSSTQTASATGCAPTGGAWSNCQTTVTWAVAFADTAYRVSCSGLGAHATGGGNPSKLILNSITKNTASVFVYTANSGSDTDISYSEIDCIAIHP